MRPCYRVQCTARCLALEPASRFRQNLMPLFDVRVRRRRQQSSWAGRGVCKTIRAAQSSPEVSPNRPGCAAARRGGRWCRMAGRRGQGGLAGVRHLLQSRRDLAPLGGASEGPQIAGLAVWPSGGAVDSGSVVPRAVGAAKARMAGCLGGGWLSCWDARRWEHRFSLGVPSVGYVCWLLFVLFPSQLGH